MPSRLPYKPDQKTRPVVDGPQMAHVVGPEGEEIYTDEYGRVKVSFPWNRHCTKNEKSSCWIRVAQNWAGAKWGHIAIPRIGQEVIVDFLEGDIDQPIITGRTYHAVNQPPYELPKHKTRMTIRSETHKGDGFNELRFEDENGQEEVFIHAQKDRNEKTLNNHTERIDNNWAQSIGANKAIEVDNNHTEVIGGNVSISVGPSGVGTIFSDKLKNLTDGLGALLRNIGVPDMLNLGEGIYTLFIEKAKTEHVGLTSIETVGGTKSLTAGLNNTISVGKDMYTSVGTTKDIHVGDRFEIVCGKSRFIMEADGTVTILGNNFYFSCHDKFELKGNDVKIN